MELGLVGKRAIITGGSRGIGAATARALHAEGARVALIGRDADALAVVADATDGHFVIADLSTTEASAAIESCIRELGGVDILVNNAGSSPSGTIDDVTDEQWQQAFDLKVLGYLRCIRAVLPTMRAQGSGRIINLGGTAGLRATPGYALAALNAALVHLTRSTAEHVGPDGISVTSVHPGPTLTDRLFTMLADPATAAGLSVEDFADNVVGKAMPLRRVGSAEEVARMITVMASDVADWVTGGGIAIDGGASMGVVGG